MRALITLLILLTITGCAAPRGAQSATPPPQPTIPALAEGLSGQPAGPFDAIGYLYITGEGASLVGGLSFSQGAPPAPLAEAGAVWLGEPPALPAEAVEAAGDVRYLVVRAGGRLSARGSYGPGGAYPYQLADAAVAPLGVRDLSIALLLENAGIYDNQPVRLSGQILLGNATALLVERIGSGGVPDSSAQQIKLLGPIEGAPLRERLTATAGGGARFGPATVVGIWRRGTLYPLAVIPG
jgi:hypothetical protein